MTLRLYIQIFRRGVWFIVGGILLAGSLSAAYALTRTPLYSATSRAFISIDSSGSVSDLTQGNAFAQQAVKSFADVATSPIVLNKVRRELAIKESSERLQQRVQATVPLDTVIVEITASDSSPSRAAQIANEVVASLRGVVPRLTPSASGATPPVTVTLIASATASDRPTSPNLPLILIGGAVVGLIAGLVVASARFLFDTRVRSVEDLVAATQSPLLGEVPYSEEVREKVVSDPGSAIAESLRLIRTNLDFVKAAANAKSIMITSAIPGEGKSTTAVNLAASVASAGQRVLVLEADLRRPRATDYLSVAAGEGLSDVLIGTTDVSSVIQRWGESSLFVMSAGTTPPNPAELLGSDRMQTLLSDLKQDYDLILVDAPPLLAVADAVVLSRYVDGTVVVSAMRRIRREQIRAAESALEAVDAVPLGHIATMTVKPSFNYGYYGAGTRTASSR